MIYSNAAIFKVVSEVQRPAVVAAVLNNNRFAFTSGVQIYELTFFRHFIESMALKAVLMVVCLL